MVLLNILLSSVFVFLTIQSEPFNLDNLKNIILFPPRSFSKPVFYAILTVDCSALERQDIFIIRDATENITLCDLVDESEPMSTYLSSNETTMKTGFLNKENIQTFISDYYNEISADNSISTRFPSFHKNQHFDDPLSLPVDSFKNFYFVGIINSSGKVDYLSPIGFSRSIANVFKVEALPTPTPSPLPSIPKKPSSKTPLYKSLPEPNNLDDIQQELTTSPTPLPPPAPPKPVFNIKEFYKAQQENAPPILKSGNFKNSPFNGKTISSITLKYRTSHYYKSYFGITNTTSNSTGNTTSEIPIYNNSLSISVWVVIITFVTIFTVVSTVLFCIICVSNCITPSVPLPSMTGERLMEQYEYFVEHGNHTREEVESSSSKFQKKARQN